MRNVSEIKIQNRPPIDDLLALLAKPSKEGIQARLLLKQLAMMNESDWNSFNEVDTHYEAPVTAA